MESIFWSIPMVSLMCAAVLVFLILIVGGILIWRYLSYRETLALAERGLARPQRPADGKNVLRWGIILAALGAAFGLGLYPLGANMPGHYPLGLGPWMLFSLIPLFFGLALILIYLVTGEKKES